MSEESGGEIRQRIEEWARIEVRLVWAEYARGLGKEIGKLSDVEKKQAYSDHMWKNYREYMEANPAFLD